MKAQLNMNAIEAPVLAAADYDHYLANKIMGQVYSPAQRSFIQKLRSEKGHLITPLETNIIPGMAYQNVEKYSLKPEISLVLSIVTVLTAEEHKSIFFSHPSSRLDSSQQDQSRHPQLHL